MAIEIFPGSAVRQSASQSHALQARDPAKGTGPEGRDEADFAAALAPVAHDEAARAKPAQGQDQNGGAAKPHAASKDQLAAATDQAAEASGAKDAESVSQRNLAVTRRDAAVTQQVEIVATAAGPDTPGRSTRGHAATPPTLAETDGATAHGGKPDGTGRTSSSRQAGVGDPDQPLAATRTTPATASQGQPSALADVQAGNGSAVSDQGYGQTTARQTRDAAVMAPVAQQHGVEVPAQDTLAAAQGVQARRQEASARGTSDGKPQDGGASTAPATPSPQPKPAGLDIGAGTVAKTGEGVADRLQSAGIDVSGQAETGRSDAVRADPARGEIRADPTQGQMRHETTQQRGDTARSAATQMVEAIRPGRDGSVDVALNPQELGRVRLTLQGNETTMHVSIASDRPETQDLLRRNIATLEQQFQDLGYGSISFDFGDGQGRPDTGSGQSRSPVFGEAEMAAIAEGPSTPAMRGLDLRV